MTAGELLALAVAACVMSVVMNWPLVLHLGQDIPKDLGDPLAESWQLAWGGHALAHQPLHFFDSNQFWPFDDTLAFSDALWRQDVWHALRIWDGWSHDWPYWREMVQHYIGGPDTR